MEFDGKILLDAYKDIPDYPYGEQPPFGCRHVWVGVARGIEDKPEEAINNIDAVFEKADDIQGAAKFAKDTLGIDYVQYDKMDIDVANMMNEEIFKAQQIFKTEPVWRIMKSTQKMMKKNPDMVMSYASDKSYFYR